MLKIALFRQEAVTLTVLIDSQTDRTVEIHADRALSPGLALGSIVTARIDRIELGLGAAFVTLPRNEKGYLPLSELEHAFFTTCHSAGKFCQGDELLVQIRQEAQKGKAVTVTGELSITGTLVVAGCKKTAGENAPAQIEVRVSKKPGQQQRNALREYALSHCAPKLSARSEGGDGQHAGKERTGAEHVSAMYADTAQVSADEGGLYAARNCSRWILLRTAAAEALGEGRGSEIERQVSEAFEKLEKIISRARFLPAGTLHHQSPSPWLGRIMGIPGDQIEKVITDDPQLFAELESSLGGGYHLELYEDRMVSLYSLYRMLWRIDEATGKIVHLKSGGNLIIEPTQAMTVIDVNTAKTVMKKNADREEALLQTNLEAAAETARQLRLRNISGIIVVDFINMREQEHRTLLMEALRTFLKADPVEAKAVDMTRLGLVEITRKKVEKPLYESLREQP